MNIVMILAPLSLALAAFFVFVFFRSVGSGQFDDLDTPAHRMLIEPSSEETKENSRVET
jgi:cbb3-type cytochrome oxidase maturation protein